MTWDADTFTELVMEPDSIPDLLVRLLVAVTIQSSTQAAIGPTDDPVSHRVKGMRLSIRMA